MIIDFELITDKLLNKQIKIESMNSIGELGIVCNLTVESVEIETSQWFGYKVTINNTVKILFDKAEICDLEELKHCMCLFRSEEELVDIYLPEGMTWE